MSFREKLDSGRMTGLKVLQQCMENASSCTLKHHHLFVYAAYHCHNLVKIHIYISCRQKWPKHIMSLRRAMKLDPPIHILGCTTTPGLCCAGVSCILGRYSTKSTTFWASTKIFWINLFSWQESPREYSSLVNILSQKRPAELPTTHFNKWHPLYKAWSLCKSYSVLPPKLCLYTALAQNTATSTKHLLLEQSTNVSMPYGKLACLMLVLKVKINWQ